MAQTVNEIRQEIDSLDNKVHDLLMKRAELVLHIGEEKRKSNVQVVQPDREIVMLRRLLARHQGPLPKEAVVRIWRELVGAVSLLQTGLKVVVTVPEDHTGLMYWDMAKDYFSSVLPMARAGNPMAALAMVREGEATFAVMPWPEDNAAQPPWWSYIIDDSNEKPMRIVARLPLGDRSRAESNPEFKALVVGRLKFDTSGEDRGFIALELDSTVSRAKIVDKLGVLDLKARSLYSAGNGNGNGKGGRSLHLAEVDGFVAADDKRLKELLKSLDCPEGRAMSLGGYPVPPVYEDKVGKNAAPATAEIKSDPEKKSA